MQIDARAELETLKRRYATELERTLASLLPNLDLTFDREVMAEFSISRPRVSVK